VFEDTSPTPDGRRIQKKNDVVAFWRGWFARNPSFTMTLGCELEAWVCFHEGDDPLAFGRPLPRCVWKKPRWSTPLRAGNPEDMDRLRHLLGFVDPNPVIDKDKTKHTGMVRYGNEPLSI
jgi:hypothetical protein